MKRLISIVPAAPLRKEPAHRSEMTSQILFGETMELVATEGEWFRIRNDFDKYEGWLTHHLVKEFTGDTALRYVAKNISGSVTMAEQLMTIPMSAHLTGFDEETRLLWNPQWKFHGAFRAFEPAKDLEFLDSLLHTWLNAPYLWGGKTLMGVDCSGFVQTVFKVMGYALPRDAWQQASQGEPVNANNGSNLKKGDVAFFQNKDGKVVHVGILRGSNEIVHASGKVRADYFDLTGIHNRESGEQTHVFHSVRRFI